MSTGYNSPDHYNHRLMLSSMSFTYNSYTHPHYIPLLVSSSMSSTYNVYTPPLIIFIVSCPHPSSTYDSYTHDIYRLMSSLMSSTNDSYTGPHYIHLLCSHPWVPRTPQSTSSTQLHPSQSTLKSARALIHDIQCTPL